MKRIAIYFQRAEYLVYIDLERSYEVSAKQNIPDLHKDQVKNLR